MCVRPLLAYQCGNGDVIFTPERSFNDVRRELSLPCGQCIECRLERSRGWAMRCMHEASLYKRNSFITLTYDDAHLPADGALDHPAFQRFMKRLRKRFAPETVRFYMCGEYGPENWRPHYHACLFNCDFDDKKYLRVMESGAKLYTSELLSELWPFGYTSVGDVTFESAAYIARYCVQKITGDAAEAHYARVGGVCEYNQMSRMPGLGAGFLEKWESDIYPHDYVVVNGKECNVPKYYDRIFKKKSAFAAQMFEDEIQYKREARARLRFEDNTPERLAVKAQVIAARAQFLKRTLE